MPETSIEYLKRRIGLKIVELADDADALDETGDDRCHKAIVSFRKAAAEWVYELLRKTTKHRPAFILADEEEAWARDIVHLLRKDIG